MIDNPLYAVITNVNEVAKCQKLYFMNTNLRTAFIF